MFFFAPKLIKIEKFFFAHNKSFFAPKILYMYVILYSYIYTVNSQTFSIIQAMAFSLVFPVVPVPRKLNSVLFWTSSLPYQSSDSLSDLGHDNKLTSDSSKSGIFEKIVVTRDIKCPKNSATLNSFII